MATDPSDKTVTITDDFSEPDVTMVRPMKCARLPLIACFACMLIAAFYFGNTARSATRDAALAAYEINLSALRLRTSQSDVVFGEADQRQLESRVLSLSQAIGYWAMAKDADAALRDRAEKDCAGAVARIRWVLEQSGKLDRLWIQ